MTIEPIAAVAPLSVGRAASPPSFADALSAAVDGLASSLDKADALGAGVALGKSSIADAAIARAKADVTLEVAAVAAGRVTGAITTLLQTQI